MNKDRQDKIKEVVDKNFNPGETRTLELFVFDNIKKDNTLFYIRLELKRYEIEIVPSSQEPATVTAQITKDSFYGIVRGRTTFKREFEMGELQVDGEYWLRDFIIFDGIMDAYREDKEVINELNQVE